MSTVPFTVYDFFAYLSSGTVLVALGDYLSGQHWFLKPSLPPGEWAIVLILAYVTGHAAAHLSALIFEQGLVQRALGRPSMTLLGAKPKSRILAILFRGYYRSLPRETGERIRTQAISRSFSGEDEALFLHALAIVTKEDRSQKRLDEFRNIYGFARNMAFTLIVVAAALGLAALGSRKALDAEWALLSLALGITMLYRYLKFFRQYSYQLLVTYAELDNSKAAAMVTSAP